jgi:hypothetical protein
MGDGRAYSAWVDAVMKILEEATSYEATTASQDRP